MFRRRTRNSTAYTGVGLPSPSAQAPDNGALAAALTIGQNLKQTKPEIYGQPQRSAPQYQPPQHTSSLLKRHSSMGSSIHSGAGATSSPRQVRTASIRSSNVPKQYVAPPQAYSVDDSFNDSELEEWGHEADAHYSNEARLRDLKLHHHPQSQSRTPSLQAPRAPKVVKMVKKYVPTPNGITVIEVPEETMKAEIARSNSMRSGLTVGRAGSMQRNISGNGFANGRSHSLTNAAKSKKQNRSRLSSLVNQPRIDEQSELQYSPVRGSPLASPRVAQGPASPSESEELQRQIEHERKLARDLERQRAEYEQLKKLRLENERKLRELQNLQEEETASFKTAHEKAPVSNGAASSIDTEENLTTPNVTTPVTEKDEGEDEDSEQEVPIPKLPFAVDELDSKKYSNYSAPNGDVADIDALHDSAISGGTAGVHDKVHESISTSPYDELVNSYGDTLIPLNEMETSRTPEESTDNFGIEEVPAESFESPNLASQLRPSFAPRADSHSEEVQQHDATNISYEFGAFPDDSVRDEAGPSFHPVPDVIDAYTTSSPKLGPVADLPEDTLLPPPTLGASSIRSVSSQDSKSKPIKSAMKTRRTSYTTSSTAKENPAHQAYLSLTTAENTRLNAKLSSPDLNETTYIPGMKPPAPKAANAQQKRMSQSLRKQPSAQSQGSQGGLAGRSLRPQSTMETQAPRIQNGGMSNRSFKVQPQPLPQHPVSKPNYQSPSKVKAAELYAKANKRPVSEFQSLPRKSSFTRDSEPADGSPNHVPRRSPHRTTLRAPLQVPELSGPAIGAAQNGTTHTSGKQDTASRGGFRSKYVDSDDEPSTPIGGSNSKGGFSSRFADSDDEGSAPVIQSSKMSSPRKTLRNTEEKVEKEAAKEKKPKKKFLRKLFGRN